jgi:hypothetical protein
VTSFTLPPLCSLCSLYMRLGVPYGCSGRMGKRRIPAPAPAPAPAGKRTLFVQRVANKFSELSRPHTTECLSKNHIQTQSSMIVTTVMGAMDNRGSNLTKRPTQYALDMVLCVIPTKQYFMLYYENRVAVK